MSADVDRGAPWYLRPVTGVAVVVLVAVVVGVSTWAVIRSGRAEARAGAVYQTGFAVPTVHDSHVVLPWGRLDLGITSPRGSLPHEVAEFDVGDNPDAPDGGAFVGVTWKVDLDHDVPQSGQISQVRAGSAPNTLVALVVHGRRFPLTPPALDHAYCASVCAGPYSSNRAWVAVAGDTSDLALDVTYDRVTQTVDADTGKVRPGRAAGLSAGTVAKPSCGTPAWQSGFRAAEDRAEATCSVAVTRTAYLRGLGWAPAGRQWLAVDVGVQRPAELRYRSSGPLFAIYSVSTRTYGLPGAGVVYRGTDNPIPGALGQQRLGGTPNDLLVYTVPAGSRPAGPLTVRATFPLDNSSGPASPRTTSATATWTVTL